MAAKFDPTKFVVQNAGEVVGLDLRAHGVRGDEDGLGRFGLFGLVAANPAQLALLLVLPAPERF